MQTIEAKYRIVTPMFIGGGDKQDLPELRPPSIKGALRFWWRAMQWGTCLNQQGGNAGAALKELHQRETELFGAAVKADKYGQGAFLLKVKTQNLKTLTSQGLDADYSLTTHRWHSYLLGLGLMNYQNLANHYLRPAIVSGSFTVEIYCKKKACLAELENLLLLWGLLGGLGSRQRKGFGSISITELKVGDNIIALPQNSEEVRDRLQHLIDRSATNEPPYTAFSTNSRILCSPPQTGKPWQCLEGVAKKMQMFRGWGFDAGHGHCINGLPAKHAAHIDKTTDHNIVDDYARPAVRTKQLPNSISFGLPRSYKLSNGNEFRLDATGAQRSRRASPVFIHVHQFSNGQSMVIQSFLPATFLPVTDQVQIQQKAGNRWNNIATVTPSPPNWIVIQDYLALFTSWLVV
jgi:CRISPR-associated protein Cmr1